MCLKSCLFKCVVVASLVLSANLATAQQPAGKSGLEAFTKAVRSDDRSIVAQMKGMGLGPHIKDAQGNNPLMLAVRGDAEKLTMKLLDFADWRSPRVLASENHLGENALMLAVSKGNVRIVQRLIEVGADVNRNGWSALHQAASTGNLEMLALLIKHRAHLNAQNPSQTTPLMLAVRFGHADAARLLVKSGADPSLKNQAGLKPRDYAIEAKNPNLAFWLDLEEVSFNQRAIRQTQKAASDPPRWNPGGRSNEIPGEGQTNSRGPSPSIGPGPGVEVFQIDDWARTGRK